MATLQELLNEYGLSGEQPAQTKVASANTQTQKNEVEAVLEGLGLSGSEETLNKVANETENKGDRVNLTDIYEELFGEVAPVSGQEDSQTKEASEEVNEGTQLFGELTAHYFGVARGHFQEKVAASLEAEAQGQDEEQPLKHLGNSGSMGKAISQQADPHMPLNHSASGGQPSEGIGDKNTYSLKEQAIKKAILKRVQVATVGAIKD